MNLNLSKKNMINQQLKVLGDVPCKILNSLNKVPMDLFIKYEKHLAYSEAEILDSYNKKLISPVRIVKILLNLESKEDKKVLHVGIGNGYFTSILSYNFQSIHSCDVKQSRVLNLKKKLKLMNIKNVTTYHNDGYKLIDRNSFDIVIFNFYIKENFLLKSLTEMKSSPKIFYFLNKKSYETAVLLTRSSLSKKWKRTVLFDSYKSLDDEIYTEEFFF